MRTVNLSPPNGDPSLAAPMILASVLMDVGLYFSGLRIPEERMGFARVLRRIGVKIETHEAREVDGVMVADVRVWPGPLFATIVPPHEFAAITAELPVIAFLMARARGISTLYGVDEDFDFIHTVLESLDVRVEADGDDVVIWGTKRDLSGRVYLGRDSYLAMAVAVAAASPGFEIETFDYGSGFERLYPNFWADLKEVTG